MPNDAAVEAAQLAPLVRNAPVGAASALLGGAIMVAAVAYEDGALRLDLALWYALLVVTYAGHVCLAVLLRRSSRVGTHAALAAFTVLGLIEGVVWSIGIVGVAASRPIEQELTVLLLGAGVAAGAALSFGSHMPTFLCRFLGATVPYILWAILQGDGLHLILALTVFIYSVMCIQLTRGFNASFIASTRLALENSALIEDLRAQKLRAERADAGKTQFLAAASHDLRQPVHALALFAAALRERRLDAESARIVERLEQSVAAMDGMFGALLDMSRLEAGVVEAATLDFAIDPMLDRIVGDCSDEAAAKRIRMVLRPSGAILRSDPVLIERIFRNLIGNAVRYTDRGGVLIGCRRRNGGAAYAVQVWDTGRGIPDAQREAVFAEFVQLAAPGRNVVSGPGLAPGLGLGLAIVRRLTTLLACPLEMRSTPGRGTMFAVTIPAGEAARATSPTSSAEPLEPASGARVLVVDDDPAVRAGMRLLLGSWGYEVKVADSSEAAYRAAAEGLPDLVICDQRLGAESGVATVAALRERHGSLPAVLITGETAPDSLAEAAASGLLLLHKPIGPARLRATIGNVLRAKEKAAARHSTAAP